MCCSEGEAVCLNYELIVDGQLNISQKASSSRKALPGNIAVVEIKVYRTWGKSGFDKIGIWIGIPHSPGSLSS
jgi:hypothetical protein